MVNMLSTENFEQVATKGLVLIDFFATWCGPCKMLSPIIDELSEEMPDVKFFKVDVDENEELVTRFGIEAMPTLVILYDGKLVNKSVGFKPKAAIKALLA